MSFSPRFVNNLLVKPYGLANQKLCYFQMFLDIDKYRGQDKECSYEWYVKTDTELLFCQIKSIADKLKRSIVVMEVYRPQKTQYV